MEPGRLARNLRNTRDHAHEYNRRRLSCAPGPWGIMSLPKGAACMLSVAAVVALGCGDPVAPAPQVAAPSQLAVRELGTGHIEVSWRDNSDNEVAFELVRSSGGPSGPFTLFASVAADVSTYQDTEVDGVANYCYQVRAVGPSGTS